jgi:hypothetical protein
MAPMVIAALALGVTAEAIVMTRPVEPVETPIPVIDERGLARVADEGRAAAKRVLQTPPPAEIRAIGSAYLAWNETGAEATAPNAAAPTPAQREALLNELRSSIGVARAKLGEEETRRHLADLRAHHTERFLCTLRRLKVMDVDAFCAELLAGHDKKDDAAELRRLAGVLPEILQNNGWADATGAPHVPESILRARYTLHWTSIVYGLDDCDRGSAPICYGLTSLPLPVEDVRALLAFLIAHPVVRAEDVALTSDPAVAADRRRLVYLDRMVALDRWADPSGQTHPYTQGYEVDLARGAMYFHLGDYAQAAESLRIAATANKNDFRARNWLLATLEKLQS